MSMALESPWGLGLGTAQGPGPGPGAGRGSKAFFAADSKDDYTTGGSSDAAGGTGGSSDATGGTGGSFRYDTPMQSARDVGGGGGGGGCGHRYAERKDQGTGLGPGPGQGQGLVNSMGGGGTGGGGMGGHDSSMGYHSFGTMPSFGSSVMGGSGTLHDTTPPLIPLIACTHTCYDPLPPLMTHHTFFGSSVMGGSGMLHDTPSDNTYISYLL